MSRASTKFRGTPIGELITGTAHQSHPTDLTAPISTRFAGQSIIAVHVALEKAATVRVRFDEAGVPRLSAIRNINRRESAEFSHILRDEAAAIGARWAVIVFATGWQAVLGHRATRPEPGERATAFSRHALMFDSPEIIYPRAQPERVYTAVDHPVLDRSIVFSVRRAEIQDLFGQIRMAGLDIASVKITIAAQIETWLAVHGDSALSRDLLITDGLGALLLNAEQGDFVAPRDAVDADQPRQSVQRPSATEEDMVRFVTANGKRPITFIGPEELFDAVKRQVGERDVIRPAGDAAHDTHLVALCRHVRHDLNFEAREVRPGIPRKWRRVVIGYVTLVLLFIGVAATNAFYAVRVGYRTHEVERASARNAADADADNATARKIVGEFEGTRAVHRWVAGNFHAQRFCYALLKEVPESAAIDKLVVEMAGSQINVTFVVLGDQSTQLRTRRAIENAVKMLRYNVGAEEAPMATGAGGNGIQYRMHVLIPDAARGSAS